MQHRYKYFVLQLECKVSLIFSRDGRSGHFMSVCYTAMLIKRAVFRSCEHSTTRSRVHVQHIATFSHGRRPGGGGGGSSSQTILRLNQLSLFY
jgi:hypothetical protein